MATPIGAFFLDTCILLNKILGENIVRTNKVFKDMVNENILCYISSSIDDEMYNKIIRTINFIGQSLKIILGGSFNYLLEQQGRTNNDKFQKKDILLIQNIFKNITNKEVLSNPANYLEEYIVHVTEEKIKNDIDFTFHDLVLELTVEIMRLTNIIQDKYEDLFIQRSPKINIFTKSPDNDLIKEIKNNAGIHAPDNIHLAMCKEYEKNESLDAVFVTTD